MLPVNILITVRKLTTSDVIVRKLAGYRFGLSAAEIYPDGRLPVGSREDLRNHRTIGSIDDLLYDQELNYINEFHPGIHPRFRSSTLIGQQHAILAGNGSASSPLSWRMTNRPWSPSCRS